MANRLYQQMTQKSSTNNIQQFANMLKGQSNPMEFLQNLSRTNPQINQVFNLLQNSNMSAKDLFLSYAKQMGVNPNEIINMLK